MGGALPFTNMQNLRTENNEDGTYRYEDFTQDGQILVVNTVEPTRLVPEVQDLEAVSNGLSAFGTAFFL